MRGERVAITGIGVVTPIGIGLEAFAGALRAGASGVRRINAFDCSGFDTQIAAAVPDDFDAAAWVEPRKSAKLMSRSALFAVAAAAMARQAAGLGAEDVDPERIGVVLGAGGMGPTDNDLLATQARAVLDSAESTGAHWDVPSFARAFCQRTNPLATLRGLPNLAAAHVAIQNNARGPNTTLTTACTAGTQAIGEGLRLIQRSEADLVFAGGTDATINPVTVLGFSQLGTLSRRNEQPEAASRPFDLDRDGFVIGEGAGVVLLERESLARSRGAPVLAELATE
jgi:3-oxoacyl-[acyl-carrier-protein] synthase II